MKIVVRCKSTREFRRFLSRNSLVQGASRVVHFEPSSATVSAILASESSKSGAHLLAVVDADLILPTDFEKRLENLAGRLGKRNPNWAVVSSKGYSPAGLGPRRFHSLDFGNSLVASSIDANSMIPVSNFEAGLLVFNLVTVSKITLEAENFSERADLLRLAFEFAIAGLAMFASGALAETPAKSTRRRSQSAKVLPRLENEWFAKLTRATKITMAGRDVIVRPVSNVDPLKNGFDLELESIKNSRIEGLMARLIVVTDANEANSQDLRRLRLSIAALAARSERLTIEHNIVGRESRLNIGAKLVKTNFIAAQVTGAAESLKSLRGNNDGAPIFWLEASPTQWVFPQAAQWLVNSLLAYESISKFVFGDDETECVIASMPDQGSLQSNEVNQSKSLGYQVHLETLLISESADLARRQLAASRLANSIGSGPFAKALKELGPRNLFRQISRITSPSEIRYLLNRFMR